MKKTLIIITVIMIVTKKLFPRYETAPHYRDFRVLNECAIDPIRCDMTYQVVLYYTYSYVFFSALFNETKNSLLALIVFLIIKKN